MKLNKLGLDLSWNYLSFAVLAVSGLLINFIVAYFYSSEGLGIFNQTYALFVIFSQFSSFGIHYSVLKLSSEESKDLKSSSEILISGMLSVLLISLLFSLLLYLLSGLLADLLESPFMSTTIKIASAALIFLSLNKVLLSFINGQERLRLFAIGNILRYIFMLLSLIALIFLRFPIKDISYIFLISEFSLTIFCLIFVFKVFKPFKVQAIYKRSIKHLRFGLKALLSGLSVELNSRVDVVILGIFASDAIVGAYSFFALVAEGFYNVYVVVKNILNPKVTKLLKVKDYLNLKKLISKTQRIIYPISIILVLMISVFIFFIIPYIPDSNIFYENYLTLIILMTSILLISGFIPFEIILTLGGRPGLQSLQTMITLVLNITLNVVLIPWYLAFGAAFATALSWIFGVIILNIFVFRYIGVRIV